MLARSDEVVCEMIPSVTQDFHSFKLCVLFVFLLALINRVARARLSFPINFRSTFQHYIMSSLTSDQPNSHITSPSTAYEEDSKPSAASASVPRQLLFSLPPLASGTPSYQNYSYYDSLQDGQSTSLSSHSQMYVTTLPQKEFTDPLSDTRPVLSFSPTSFLESTNSSYNLNGSPQQVYSLLPSAPR